MRPFSAAAPRRGIVRSVRLSGTVPAGDRDRRHSAHKVLRRVSSLFLPYVELQTGHAWLTSVAPVLTVAGTIVGSAAYMSPEQADARPIDARSDIFAFGSVLYEMLTGRPAFHGDSSLSTMVAILRDTPPPPSRIAQGIPPALDALVIRCLEKNPDHRYQTMREVREALERAATICSSLHAVRIASTISARSLRELTRSRPRR